MKERRKADRNGGGRKRRERVGKEGGTYSSAVFTPAGCLAD